MFCEEMLEKLSTTVGGVSFLNVLLNEVKFRLF